MTLSLQFSDERGAAAIEFALVLPLLVLLLTGIVEFTRVLNNQEILQHAVRDGARVLALKHSSDEAITVTKQRAADGQLQGTPSVTTQACPATPSGLDYARVTATYPVEYHIPLFDSGTITINVSSSMRCNG